MAARPRSATQHLTDNIARQHLALSVAAHLARSQLVPDPLKAYDAQQMADTLNVIATSLARTAPLWVVDRTTGQSWPIDPAELRDAVAKRAATVLELKGGQTLEGVSIRRADLRQAVAVLRTGGFSGLLPPQPPATAQPAANESHEAVRARFAELEQLLTLPLLPEQVERAKARAVWIARHAREGRVANLAMQLMSALHETHDTEEVPGGYRLALARLRAALEQKES